MLTKRFHTTLFNGLKNQSIRSELREYIKSDSIIRDQDLIKIVSEAVLNEAERNEKFSVKKTINALVETEISEILKEKEKKSSLPAQIESMKISHEREMAALRADIKEIKSAILGKPGFNSDSGSGSRVEDKRRPPYSGRRRVTRCQMCERNNFWRCTHCFKCGGDDHRMNMCPMKQNDQKN